MSAMPSPDTGDKPEPTGVARLWDDLAAHGWTPVILRYASHVVLLILVAGIFIPLALLALLLVIPYLIDRSKDGTAEWFNRPGRVAQIIAILIFSGLIILTFVEVGQ